ncbi:DUF1499 domain-containing protein [Acidaminobacter sp. JC074]|uniref:DUF1499 domain-containing protein n=1 Tax=Acidaminobacter sp. JC074 TaxID=2530199 RepID=UPI001F0F83E4|nr:DUF1499 domain-containing protein [Acidaminobacter sp. JC074]MCH4889483.1 DUF1499 domain-containing protein [Acidaminobacter sp. JC074]
MKKIGLLILSLMLIVLTILAYQNGKTPDLGLVDGHLKELKNSPNGVSSQTSYEEKRIAPFTAYENSMMVIEEIILAYRGLIVKKEANYVHVIFTTKKGFRDDVEFLIDGDLIHYRSQSRVGYGDMNKNIERYLEIKTYYENCFK